MRLITIATLERVSSLQDKTLKIVFATNEMTGEEAGKLFSLQSKALKVLVTDDNIIDKATIEAIETADMVAESDTKSPSQRLRGVMFRNWEQMSKGHKTFDAYYRSEMELLINHFKQKLEP